MKKIKIALLSIVFLTVITGIIVAKENGKKRTLYFTAYYSTNGATSHSVYLTGGYFSDVLVTNQASIKNNLGTATLLYANQSRTKPVDFWP